MALQEILNLVWMNIRGNKSKVLLTSLGIIVGAATIVIVIAIGLGGQQDVQEQFKNLNAGTITIADNSGSASSGGMGGGAVDIFNERGVEVIVGVQGEAQTAVETYLRGELISTGSICHQHEHAHECGEHN